jgi:hypothetical protein
MARFEEKLIARNIRRRGKSIKDIAKELNIGKSTISIWCRDIKLSAKQIENVYKNGLKKSLLGGLIGAEVNHQKKLKEIDTRYKEASRIVGKLSVRDLLIAGICLYWAEGSKTKGRFIFVNSDPVMIKVIFIFLTKILKIDKNLIKPTIQINLIHQPRIKKVMKFWSRFLDIPLDKFGKSYFIKTAHKKVYENYNNYYGIVRLQVLKGSSLQYKMLGFIDVFRKYAGVV